ncbi:pentatricopeptide repeat-containing protein At2g20540-like [Neltuma alba]|uniref:pentatricopeptide repeat-containing protein At2g20540-like n=1 Tax=Neltuma alba TaxID=207710 RepID=UPI0010A3253A|nr:pentatricopeptide repeat-containing protein At2g20540-like [Prosopis alba]
MISSYTCHGQGQHALEVYSQMLKSKVTPNEVTLLSLLTACIHSGLVLEGKMLFNRMIHYHHLKPNFQHYGCLVDLLGRSGFLEEAKEMIELMPIEPDATIWRSFLTACLVHGNLNLAVIAGRKVIGLEPSGDGLYVLLWNAYYTANMWKEALEVRKLMRTSKVRRKLGCSWVEVNGIVQEFYANDTLLHYSYELCLLLEELKDLSKTEPF